MEQDPAEPLGTEAILSQVFLSVENRLQPPWPSLSSKGQIQTLLIKGGAAKKILWGKIKGSAVPEDTQNLSATPLLNHCYETPHQILPGGDA